MVVLRMLPLSLCGLLAQDLEIFWIAELMIEWFVFVDLVGRLDIEWALNFESVVTKVEFEMLPVEMNPFVISLRILIFKINYCGLNNELIEILILKGNAAEFILM